MAQTSEKPIEVLVSGGGVAGPCLTWWLTRPEAERKVNVTIIERAARPRPAGQNIDIRGRGIKVVERMGLLDQVRGKNTGERGVSFVNSANVTKAVFPVEEDGGSFTSEFEITRSDLVQVFLDATQDREGVRYVYDESISSVAQDDSGARVEFTNGTPAATYDYVIGADGLGSKVRRLVWPEAGSSVFKSLGMYGAYFTIPKGPLDTPIARWYPATGRRTIFLRPDNQGQTRVFLSIIKEDPRVADVLKHGVGAESGKTLERQKALCQDLFEDAGWEAERVLADMHAADDFYMQEIAQIHMGSLGWCRGRVALLGDAGYCPSPMSGMGTTIAISGAYFLAGEILKHGHDYKAALKAYEQDFGPQAAEAQKLFPGAPKLASPSSAAGIWIMGNIMRTLAALKINKWFTSGDKLARAPLPDFGQRSLAETPKGAAVAV